MDTAGKRRAAILLGAGGHNLKGRQRVRALAAELERRAQRGPGELAGRVVAAFLDPGKSERDLTLGEAVAKLAAEGVAEIAVVPYLLEWHYPEQYDVPDLLWDLAREYPQMKLRLAQALGGAPELGDVLAERLAAVWSLPDAASATVRQVAEVADQSPVTAATLKDGELPKLPAHAQHLLVCLGRRCMEQGSPDTYRALTARLAERGLDEGPQRVKVTRTKCLSPCQAAPVACLYPSGTFYAHLTPDTVPAFVDHVLVAGGELPGRTFQAGEA